MVFLCNHCCSVASGILACLASVFGKVAFDSQTSFHSVALRYCGLYLPETVCGLVGYGVQAGSLVLMLILNAVMLSTFLRALKQSGSTAATALNCATNFLLSGVCGAILFGEQLPLGWWGGATCIIVGVALIASSETDDRIKEA